MATSSFLRSVTALASSSKMVSRPHPLFSSGGVRGHFSSGGVRGHFSSGGFRGHFSSGGFRGYFSPRFKDTSKTTTTWWAATKVFYMRTMYGLVRVVFRSERRSRPFVSLMLTLENFKEEWVARSKGVPLAMVATRLYYASVNDALNDFCSIYTPVVLFISVGTVSLASFCWSIFKDGQTDNKIENLETGMGDTRKQLCKLQQIAESCQAELKIIKNEKEEEEKKKKEKEEAEKKKKEEAEKKKTTT